jgi:hypothetical protein
MQLTVTILESILRPVFYLKHTLGYVHTAQEAHYLYTTSSTG